MSEENKNVNAVMTAEDDYRENFMPAVHKIGRFTMVIAFFLTILPFLYFYFVKGYKVEFSLLIAGLATMFPMLLGGWISEPFTYWPILGSAGTYMSYLAGNVSSMRFPVASAVQKDMDADINTPRGQLATIVGLAASIVINLVILFFTVIIGEKLIAALPARVVHSFSYCVNGLIGSMVLMRIQMNKGGMVKGIVNAIPYVVSSLFAWFMTKKILVKAMPKLSSYGTLVAVGLGVIVAWFRYKKAVAEFEAQQAK